MPEKSAKQAAAYADALAAFKQDSSENGIIASVLREHLNNVLIAPVLDVGAGSGELAELAFSDRTAVLLDLHDHPPSTNPLHHRIQGDFLNIDLSAIRASTIIFCHSLNFLTHDMERLSHQLRQSGVGTAVIVSNENTGTFGEIVNRLIEAKITCNPPFHVPVPAAKLETRIPFSISLKCPDFRRLSQHFVRILLDCDLTNTMLALVEEELHRVATTPQVEIAEAIYIYRLHD